MTQITAQCGIELTTIFIIRLLFLDVLTKFPIISQQFSIHFYCGLDLAVTITLYKFLNP